MPLRTTAQVLALYSTIGAAGAFVLFGHARAASPAWVVVGADVVHVVCAAVWLGGLIGLVVVLRARTTAARRRAGEIAPPDRPPSAPAVAAERVELTREPGTAVAVLDRPATVAPTTGGTSAEAGQESILTASTVTTVRRVSTMAAVSVMALMAARSLTSLIQWVPALFENNLPASSCWPSWRCSGCCSSWPPTTAGCCCRGWPRRATTTGHAERLHSGWRVLMRTARVEVLGVVAVLAITAMLTNTTPPSATAAVPVPVPFSKSAAFAGGHLRIRISPNQALVNDVHIDITDAAGRPVDHAKSVSAFFTLPSKNVGPLASDLKRVGVSTYALLDTPLPPIVGQWQITVQIRVDDFNEVDLNFTDDVR